ncbi:hypothetical protein BGW38_010557 [Lunasporangiospora selenospora]|uniref:Uncharacterized protein n=1 Tax=Lunasporangiospora selenospora TaxID=979761 RepID=A0A9P6KFG4_9FUNG|nr:hypothetical protein BGW38_010557 [Lunasporangiospora selenospora]
MEQQYFGLEDPRDKYRLYDTVTSTLDEEKMVYRKQTSSLGEHDRVAFVPMQLNSSFTRIIRWCDGIDLRAHEITFTENKPSWDDCVVDYRSGALSQREFMTAYRHMNNGMDGGMDSVQVHVFDPMDAYAPHGAAACRCCEKPQYSPFRVIVDFFKSMRNVESEKSRTRGHNSKLRILKIVALVVVNTILVIKAVQIYQERVAGPPSHWPKDMETYPGGVIWHDSQTATPSLVPTI